MWAFQGPLGPLVWLEDVKQTNFSVYDIFKLTTGGNISGVEKLREGICPGCQKWRKGICAGGNFSVIHFKHAFFNGDVKTICDSGKIWFSNMYNKPVWTGFNQFYTIFSFRFGTQLARKNSAPSLRATTEQRMVWSSSMTCAHRTPSTPFHSGWRMLRHSPTRRSSLTLLVSRLFNV